MSWEIAGYLLSLMACSVLAVIGWQGRRSHPVLYWSVAGLGLSMIWWTMAVLIGRLVFGADGYPAAACVVLPIALPAIAAIPALLLVMSRALCDMAWRPNRVLIALLAVEPIAITVAGITNSRTGAVITCHAQAAGFGPAFWIHSVYCYLLIGLAVASMFRELIDTSRRGGLVLFVISLGIILTGNVITLVSEVEGPDVTAAFFGVGISLMCYSILRHRILDILPMAKVRVLDLLAEGVLVVDVRGRQVHINPAGRAFLLGSSRAIVSTSGPLDPKVIETFLRLVDATSGSTVMWNGREIEVRTSEVTQGTAVVGRILTLSDVTEHMRDRRRLDEVNTALRRRIAEVDSLREDLAERVIRDPLTGMYNRAYLDQLVESLLADPPARAISIALLDIDHFKSINDGYGHQAGDRVLIRVAGLVQAYLGATCAVTRFGGDELLVLTAQLTRTELIATLNDVRTRIDRNIAPEVGIPVPITISAGVASTDETGYYWLDLVNAADAALYRAKRQGRDRIVCHRALIEWKHSRPAREAD